jgi:hypothetical protein
VQHTVVIGARSWYFNWRESDNLRLDVDRNLPGQGSSMVWGPFIMAIAKVPDNTPDFYQLDPDGKEFAQLARLHCHRT